MADGRNGWSIPSSEALDPEERDRAEAAAIFEILETQIIPEFFDEGQVCSARWIERMRQAWRSLGTEVTAARMISEYQDRLYAPALNEVREL